MVHVLLSPKGRIDRQVYWLQGILPLTVLLISFAALGAWLVSNSMGLGILLAPFPLIYPYFAVSAKRFHDLNLSSWWLIAFLEVWPESHWQGFAQRQANVLQSYMA